MSERAPGPTSWHTSREWRFEMPGRGSLWHSKYGFSERSRSTATERASIFAASNCGRCLRISRSHPEPAARLTASSMRCGRWRSAVAQCPPTLVRRCTPTRVAHSQRARARLDRHSRWRICPRRCARRVDVGLFEALVHSAGEPGCSAVRRVEVLDKALALWRGQALDGFHDREWARPDATRLQEIRAIRGRRSRRGAAGTWRCDGRRTAAHSSGVDRSSSGADPCAADDCVAAKWPPGRSAASLPAVPPPPGYRSRAGSRRRHQGVGSLDRQRRASVARPGQRWPRRAGVRAAGAHRRWEVRSRVSRAPALGRTRGGHQGDPLGARRPARVRQAVRDRGPVGRQPRAPAHRAVVRLLADTGMCVPRHALVP